MEKLNDILKKIVSENISRMDNIKKYQEIVFDADSNFFPSIEEEEIYRNLAYDLEFFEPQDSIRKEDMCYYGEERLRLEIEQVLNRFVK